MFIGHFALGYAAKKWAPQLSLGVLFAAVVLADLIWPVLVALGIEHVRIAPGYTASTPFEFISYPYSHSLLTLVLWGGILGWITAPQMPAFALVVALVVSHWVLDFITHVPDMPLYPGGPKFGLGLWNWVSATVAVEMVMFAIGVWIYMKATRPRDRIGRWGFIGVTAFLLVGFLGDAVSSAVPPSVTALWTAALALGVLTIWLAWWTDKHRASAR
jgi:hypothetical protein